MAFWRPWVRALIGASGVTLLLPAGLVVAVALATTLGGTGLGGLAQLVSGPELPGGPATTVAETGVQGQSFPALPVARTPVARRPERASGREPSRAGSSTTGSRPVTTNGSTTTTSSGTANPSAGTSKPPTADSGPPSASNTPKPPSTSVIEPVVQPIASPVRSTLQRIGDAAKGVLEKVPVVGKPLANAVGTVVDLLSNPLPGG